MEADSEYIVSQILQIRLNKFGESEYYLIWEGYEDDGPCWENEGDLYDLGAENLSEALAAFREKKTAKKQEKKQQQPLTTKVRQPAVRKAPQPKKPNATVPSDSDDDFDEYQDDAGEIDSTTTTTASCSTDGVIHRANASNAIAASLLRPWTMTHLKALPKIPKNYVLRLVHMCAREFLQRVKLSTRTLRVEVTEFLAIYRKWCDLLSSQPQTRSVQPQYFMPVDSQIHILSLPHDALFTAFIQLDDLRDIIACSGTCVSWNTIACSGRFWRPMYLACATVPSQAMIARYHGDYRELFFLLLESWGRPQQSRGQANALCLSCQEFAGVRQVKNFSLDRTRVKLLKLLEKGYDPNFPGKRDFPMRIALASGDLELIQLLMVYGGNPTPFMLPTGKNAVMPFYTDEVWKLVRSYQELHEAGKDGGAIESRRHLRRRGWKNRFANNGDSWLKNLDFKSA